MSWMMTKRHCARLMVMVIVLGLSPLMALADELPMPLMAETPVDVVQAPQEVTVRVSQTNAMAAGGGLLGGLIVAGIDNERTKRAEVRLAGIRDLLLVYDFNSRLEQQLRSRLPDSGWATQPSFKFASLADIQANAPQQLKAVMVIPSYSFDNNFDELQVSLKVEWVERQMKGAKIRQHVPFSGLYTYHLALPAGGKVDANVARWKAMNKQELEALVDTGIVQTVNMMVFNMSPEGRLEWDKYERRAMAFVGNRGFRGRKLREGPEWVWTSSGEGDEQILDAYQPVVEGVSPSFIPLNDSSTNGEKTAPAADVGAVPEAVVPASGIRQ